MVFDECFFFTEMRLNAKVVLGFQFSFSSGRIRKSVNKFPSEAFYDNAGNVQH